MSEPARHLDWGLPAEIEDRGRLPKPRRLRLGANSHPEHVDLEGLVRTGEPFEEFLASEEQSERKHEYLQGRVYAMAGADEAHNTVTGNIFARMHAAVRRSPCRVYQSDMALRADSDETYFYPDVMATCSQSDAKLDRFKRAPTILIEVLSKSTSKRDQGEKKDHYLSISSLRQYWLVSKDRCHIEVYRRSGADWICERFETRDDAIEIPELNVKFRLADVYEGVAFVGDAAAP